MRRYIILLLITGIVWAQTDFDRLVMKDGTIYLGEYSKTEEEIVYFKPQNALAFQPVPVPLIKSLKLKDGDYIIGISSQKIIKNNLQDLHLRNQNNTIKIKVGSKLQVNNKEYTLFKTDYLEGFVYLKEHKSQILDTLSFDSILSLKYYKPPVNTFCSSVIVGAVGAAALVYILDVYFSTENNPDKDQGSVGDELNEDQGSVFKNFNLDEKVIRNVVMLGFGGIGAFFGAIYGVLPSSGLSKEIKLKKDGWSIKK